MRMVEDLRQPRDISAKMRYSTPTYLVNVFFFFLTSITTAEHGCAEKYLILIPSVLSPQQDCTPESLKVKL